MSIIDCSVGEPHLIRDCLQEAFNLIPYSLPNEPGIWDYPNSNGNKDLIQILEDRYKAPVVITNGAMQGLHASFYVLKSMGKKTVSWDKPWFHCLPKMAEVNGLQWKNDDADAVLLVAPRNPDGFMPTIEQVQKIVDTCKEKKQILIHDAAYYTHTYLPETHLLKPIGDVQVFSASKAYGLSGLRLGWVVCWNKDFYQPLCEYMEMMTVGASNLSQLFLRDLLTRMYAYPSLTGKFEGLSSMALEKAKTIIKGVNPEVLEVPKDFEKSNGMFGFFKKGAKADFEKAKVHVADGKHFGAEEYVRLNLAFGEEKMNEIVKRLNESVA